MKTKEEVINHVKKVGYAKMAIKQICAFMIGAELKEEDEYILFLKDGSKSFKDFLDWYKIEKKDVHDTLYDSFSNTHIVEDFQIGDIIVYGIDDGTKQINIGKVVGFTCRCCQNEKEVYVYIRNHNNEEFEYFLTDFDFAFVKRNED